MSRSEDQDADCAEVECTQCPEAIEGEGWWHYPSLAYFVPCPECDEETQR